MNIRKILSLSHLGLKIEEVVGRFPVAFADAFLGTIAAVYIINSQSDRSAQTDSLEKILFVLIAGFFLFLATAIICEKKKISKIFANIAVANFLVVYFFTLPADMDGFREIHFKRNFIIVLCSVLLLMVAPYFAKDGRGFWHYNKQLFLRFFFTFVSSATFFAGAALSLASLGYLFGVNIREQWYFSLWAMVVGFMSTSIFMTGIPSNFSALKKETQYPKVIKTFSQNILLPIIVLYAVLLYAYMVKIIFTGVWPEGMVAYLVVFFAFFGIATMLLLYPLRETSERIRIITKYYYAILIAPLVLLFAAIKIRVSDYGLTDGRCMLFLLGFWLLCMSAYFLLSKKYDIRIIFYSLIFVLVFSFFAPINIFSISAKSQINELSNVMNENSMLSGGKIQKAEDKKLSKSDYEKINSILAYLYAINRIEEVNVLFDEKVDIEKNNYSLSHENFFKAAGIVETGYYNNSDSGQSFSSEAKDDYLISDFDYFVRFDLSRRDDMEKVEFGEDKNFIFSMDGFMLKIARKQADGIEEVIIEKNIVDFLSKIYKLGNEEELAWRDMMLEIDGEKGRAKIHFDNLLISGSGNDLMLESANGVVFFSAN